jgi:hypothetical protein
MTALVAVDAVSDVDVVGVGANNFDFGGGHTVPPATGMFAAKLDAHGHPLAVTGSGDSSSSPPDTPLPLGLAPHPSGDFLIVGEGHYDSTSGALIVCERAPAGSAAGGSATVVSFAVDFAPGAPAQAPPCVWQQRIPASTVSQGWTGVTADAQGNVFLAGSNVGGPLLLEKLDASGHVLWSIPPSTQPASELLGVATDGGGNVYVLSIRSVQGYVLDRYDPNGNLTWSRLLQATTHLGSSGLGGQLAVDASGNATVVADVAGTISVPSSPDGGSVTLGNPDGMSLFVASFDAAGGHRWSHAFALPQFQAQSQTFQFGVGPKVVLGPNGQSIVGGSYWSTIDVGGGPLPSTGLNADDRNVFLAAFDGGGALVWSHGYGGPHTNTLAGLGGNGSGTIALVGNFSDAIQFGDFGLTAPDGGGYAVGVFLAIANLQ